MSTPCYTLVSGATSDDNLSQTVDTDAPIGYTVVMQQNNHPLPPDVQTAILAIKDALAVDGPDYAADLALSYAHSDFDEACRANGIDPDAWVAANYPSWQHDRRKAHPHKGHQS